GYRQTFTGIERMSVLVFGASGFLGSWIRTYLEHQGETVTGTCFSKELPGLKRFDLRKDNLTAIGSVVESATFAIICSSTTDMDRCRSEGGATYELNVEKTNALIVQLQDAGIVPIFISTDYVYDGVKGGYSEDDERNPVLAYGQQKVEVENFLLGR